MFRKLNRWRRKYSRGDIVWLTIDVLLLMWVAAIVLFALVGMI